MRKRNSGFTLIEILVAVAIFGLLIVGAYTVLDAGMKSKEQTETRLNRLEHLQRMMHQFEQDMVLLSTRQVRNEFGDKQPQFRAQGGSGDEASLEFTRANWRNPLQLPRSNLQHVIYTFKDGVLTRSHSIFLDQSTNSPTVDRLLIDRLDSLKFEFLNQNNQWLSDWANLGFIAAADDSDTKDILPKAVRISIELEPFGEIERIILVGLSSSKLKTKDAEVVQ